MRSVMLRVCQWTCASAILLSTIGCPSAARDGGDFATFGALRQNYTVPLGSQLRLPIQAFEANGTPLTVVMNTFPMPANCRFREATGELIFTPDPSQVRTFEFDIQVNSSRGAVSQTLLVEVRRRTGPTDIRGVVMDADTGEPVGNVEVRAPGTSLTTRTNGQGVFLLSNLQATATPIVEIDGGTAGDWALLTGNTTALLGHPLFEEQDNVIPLPIYLPRRGAALGRVGAGQGTTVQNPDAGVTLTIAADAARRGATPFTGDLFMPEVPATRLPAALPAESSPSLMVTVQPAGLTFDPPAQLTWPNRDNLEVGSEVDIWSLDPASGLFADVGDAVVEANGSIRTIRGGLTHSSWHFLLPDAGAATGETPDSIGDNDDMANQCAVAGAARILLRSGNLVAEHSLPSYRSMGEDRGLRLVYNLKSADPRPILNSDLSLPAQAALPDLFRTQLIVGGIEQAQEVFTKATRDQTRTSWQLDGRSWPTGRYSHEIRLEGVYGTATRTARVVGGTLVANERQSPIGAGWTVAGVPRLYPVDGQPEVTLTEGDGSIKSFRPTNTNRFRTNLYFVLDGSASLSTPVGTTTRWELQLAGLQAAVRDSSIVPLDRSFSLAVLSFGGNGAQTHVPLTVVDSATTAENLAQSIGAIPFPDGASPMAAGILEAVNALGPVALDRHVICITSNGNPGDQQAAEAAANRAIAQGADQIDVLGVGADADLELLQGVVRQGTLIAVPSFEAFASDVGQKVRQILSGAPAGEFSSLMLEADGSYTRSFPNRTTQRFDAAGLLQSITDRRGQETTYAYDAESRITAIRDPAGLETVFAYNGDGLLQSVLRPGGRETTFGHQGRNLVRITDPAGAERRFEYGDDHRLVALVNRRGQRTTYGYHPVTRRIATSLQVETGVERKFEPSQTRALPLDPAAGNTSAQQPGEPVLSAGVLASYTDGNGGITSVRTDRFGRPLVYTDPQSRTTTTVRDGNGLPRQITRVNGRVDAYRFDQQGNLLSRRDAINTTSWTRTWNYGYDPKFNRVSRIVDPAGSIWIYTYDQVTGDLQSVLNPLGKERFYSYRGQGLVETIVDENSRTTRYEYNALGQVQSIRGPTNITTEITRDGAGNPLTRTEAAGTAAARTQSFAFDTENRITSVTDGGGATTSFAYDAEGNLLRTILPTGEAIVREYDGLDRLVRLTNPVDGTTEYSYDNEGNVLARKNALGQTTTFEYDPVGQLRKIIDPLGAEERYSYNPLGTVSAFRNKAGEVTTFSYDPHGRRGVVRNASNRTQRFLYDSLDNLITHTQGDGSSITYTYDALGRLQTKRVPAVVSSGVAVAANTIRYTYDDVGNLRTISDDDTALERTYDAFDRVREEKTLPTGTQPVVTLTSEYDVLGNRTDLRDSLGGRTGFEFDAAGNTRAVVLSSNARIGLDYDATGRPTATNFPNGMVSTLGYGPGTGRLEQLTHGINGQAAVVDLALSQDGVGNITGITEPGRTRGFVYDARLQLAAVVETGAGESYSYDTAGNRTVSHLSSIHRYSRDHELLEDDSFTYTFDGRGNLESRTPKSGGGALTLIWDAQNLLIEARISGGSVIRYRHDGLGRKVARDPGGGPNNITSYIYDDAQIVLEQTNGVTTRHAYGPLIDQVLASTSPSGDLFYHADHLGSVRAITDETGAEVGTYSYDSFGNPTLTTGAAMNAAQAFFTGRQWDAALGLYDYRARWYDPQTGRFLSADPLVYDVAEAGTNPYRYVDNRPLVFTDPTGECPWCVAGAIGGLADIGVQLWQNAGRSNCWNGREAGLTTATGTASSESLRRLTKIGQLATATTDLSRDRATYRWVKVDGMVQAESHPLQGFWPDWANYPRRHTDALGKSLLKWHQPQVEPEARTNPVDGARNSCLCR